MAGYGSGWGGSDSSPYGAFWTTGTTEPTNTSSSSGAEGTLGLPSPKGDKIPQGIGTFAVPGQLIVDPNLLGGVGQSGDKVTVNLVLAFCETTLGGDVSLINLKADDQYIYRTETPTKPFPGTIRFYGGDQTALDPLLSSKLTNPTYWPKLAYAVLEGFDIAPYGNQLPSFQAEVSTGVEATVLASAEATINFGALHDGSAAEENAIDTLRNHFYTVDFDYGANEVWILTFDVITNQEIARCKMSWAGGTFDYTGMWVALDGADYMAITIVDNADNYYKLALVNTVTGVISAVVPTLTKESVPFEPEPRAAQLLSSGASTKYLVYSAYVGTLTDGGNSLMVTVADVTAGTMTNIVHQYTNPVVTDGRLSILGLVPGPVSDGQAVMFFVPSNGNNDGTVWKAVFSDAGLVSAAEIYTGTNCKDVAYDWSDNSICVYRYDDHFIKVDSDGAIVYDVDLDVSGLWFNFGAYQTGGMFHYKARAGYAAAQVVFGSGDVYVVDLSSGAISKVLDGDDYSGYFTYLDQTLNYFITDNVSVTGMERITLPLSTVPTYDLQNIYTKLAEYRGKFSASDLIFDGFTGGECYGVVYSSDTTLDNAEQDANNVFDVKIVPSDGKRKYVKAKRDGSFALDDTIDSDAIVEQAEFNIQKTMNADEQSLVGARISYIDKNARFERTEQEYRRPVGIYSVTRSDRIEDVSTSFVLSSTQAMQAVTTKVYRSNFGLDVYNFTLAPEKFYLEPSDIVQFDFEGFTIVGQINDGNLSGENFTQDLTVTQYVQAIDASYTGIDFNLPDITNPSWLTRFLYLDGPLLSAGDDLGGVAIRQYAMLSGYGYGDFQGATLYRSYEGNTYSVVTSKYGVTPVIGLLKSVTGSPDATVEAIDATTVIEVSIVSGDTDDLATITEAAMLAGGNKALIGNVGRWVVVHFQTVSVTDKIATLSDIVWSSPFYQPHLDALAAGDYFVFLQPGHHVRFSGEVTKLGDDIFYKAASDAFPIASVPTESRTLVARAETPFPPLHLAAVINGSDIDLSWDWRSRLHTGSVLPGSDNNPAGEATLAFEIDIMDGATVKRTLTATTNSKTYLDADIITDWGTMPDDLTFRVYQMSALVGRGYVAEATIVLTGSVGSAAGVGSATAVGASIAASVASAAGIGAASAIGGATIEGIGSAAGTSTAQAVSQPEGAGSAAGTSTATGVGASTAAATASATGTGSASGVGAAVDPNFSSVVLLCGFNGVDGATSSSDESSSAKTLTFVGNAQLDTAQTKFGSASLLLDGTGDRVTAADSIDWQLGSTNSAPWTVEAWVRWNVLDANNRGIMGQSFTGTLGWTLTGSSTIGELNFSLSNSGSAYDVSITTSGASMTTGVWYHVAADKDSSGKIRLYVDGVMRGSSTPANSAINNSTTQLAIGAQSSDGVADMNGWLDEVRITKGVARYASDSGFTVPTAAYPRS